MSAYDSRTKLEALRDQFETFGKGANYLLVGHGAGFLGCLSVFKDHSEVPQQFQAILGQLILLFGCGLLLSSLFWVFAMTIKIRVTQAIIAQEKPSRSFVGWLLNRSIELLAHVGMWGSLAAFVAAIILIMTRFTDALPPDLIRWWQHWH
jgi:ascorbate-specific PTS system EIIC-type component UlaA